MIQMLLFAMKRGGIVRAVSLIIEGKICQTSSLSPHKYQANPGRVQAGWLDNIRLIKTK